ncbi:hypothetical protein ACI79O_22830 [Geodermatophilus sp. SYSU D00696]
MSQAARPPDPQEPRRGMPPPRPRRGRAVFFGTFLALLVAVFAFILLVSQCGTGDDDEVYDDDVEGAALVVDVAAPPLLTT